MPIKIPTGLPAGEILSGENVFTMEEARARTQDIRPLKIAILNLMPTKIDTETQLIRLLSNTPLQVDLTLLHPSSYRPSHTSERHMLTFYKSIADIRKEKFDGLIITGAPVENLDFEAVIYWDELCEIMDWSKSNVCSTLYICWAAQAGLFYHYGIPKYALPQKLFGVYRHQVLVPTHPLLRGFDECFVAPHSRHTEIHAADIAAHGELTVLADSAEAGVYIVADNRTRRFFITGHSEYDYDTLAREYFRDRERGLPIQLPANYFPENNPDNRPPNLWRGHAHLLFSNWLNYFVYQETPFNLEEIG